MERGCREVWVGALARAIAYGGPGIGSAGLLAVKVPPALKSESASGTEEGFC